MLTVLRQARRAIFSVRVPCERLHCGQGPGARGQEHEVIYAAGHQDDELGRERVHSQENVQKPLATKVLHFLGQAGKVSPHRRCPSDLPCQGRGHRRQKVNHLHQAVVYSTFSLTSGVVPLCLFLHFTFAQ